MTSYRRSIVPAEPAEASRGDRDVLAPMMILWAASVFEVLATLRAQQPIGAESTLALVFVVGVPLLLMSSRIKNA